MIYPNNTRRDNFYANAEVNVERGDHIRLQYISVSYEPLVPAQIKKTVKGLQVYININNIGILWKANKAGIDPDYKNTDVLPGVTTTAGIKLSF